MTVTLADVAKRVGVSASTVSRALSSPDKVNPQTRQEIMAVVEAMGYVPNQVAKSLNSGRRDALGIVVPDIANPFFPPIIKAVQARAARLGHSVLISDSDEQTRDELGLVRELVKRSDGVIVVSPRSDPGALADLAAREVIVFINREIEGAVNVLIDDGVGVGQAVEHLHALGHRRVCYLAGPARSWSNKVRRAAARAAAERVGVELVEYGPFNPQMQAGVRAADLVVASGATGVIAYDDLIASGLMLRLAQRGVSVPGGISVIGVDNSALSGMSYPTLTSVSVPCYDAGVTAVNIMNEHLSGKRVEPQTIQLETELVVRGSTGDCPR